MGLQVDVASALPDYLKALLAGADEFMEKPVTARGLLICLGRLAAKVQ